MIKPLTLLLVVAVTFLLTVAGVTYVSSACGQVAEPADTVDEPPIEDSPSAEGPKFDPSKSDAEAILLVERLWKQLGGKEAYDRIDFISFTFQVDRGPLTVSTRNLIWDRRTDRLRAFMKTSRGELVVLVNLSNSTGVAIENGKPVPEEDAAGVVEYVRDNFFRSDFFWLVAPWRLKDPGVHLHLEKDVEREGTRLKRVRVTFDKFVTFAPAGQYWFLINPETDQLAEWGFRLAGMPEDQSPTWFTWTEWVEKRGVKFSTVRQQVGGQQKILCRDLETPALLPPDLFEGL